MCVWAVRNCFSGLWSIKIGYHLNQFTFICLVPRPSLTVSNSSVYCWNSPNRSLNQSLRTYFTAIKTNGTCCCCFVFQSPERKRPKQTSQPRCIATFTNRDAMHLSRYLCWLDLCVKWSWSPHSVLIWVSESTDPMQLRHTDTPSVIICSTSLLGKGWRDCQVIDSSRRVIQQLSEGVGASIDTVEGGKGIGRNIKKNNRLFGGKLRLELLLCS